MIRATDPRYGRGSTDPHADLLERLLAFDVAGAHPECELAIAQTLGALERVVADPYHERSRAAALGSNRELVPRVVNLGLRELARAAARGDAGPPRLALPEAKPLLEPQFRLFQRCPAGVDLESQPRVLRVRLLELHRCPRLAGAAATLDRRLGIGGLTRSVVAGELGVEDRRARVAEIHRGPDQSPGSAVESQLEVGDRDVRQTLERVAGPCRLEDEQPQKLQGQRSVEIDA